MNFLSSFLLILAMVFVCLISSVIKFRRSLGEGILDVVRVDISVIIAVVLLKAGIFRFLTKIIFNILPGSVTEIFAESELLESTAYSAVGFFINIFMFVLIFWIISLLFKLIFSIIIKKTKLSEKKLFAINKNNTSAIIVSVCRFVLTWFICVVTILPLTGISYILSPAIKEAKSAESKSYVKDVSEGIEQSFYIITEDSLFNNVLKYTGSELLTDAVMNSLGKVTLKGNNVKVQSNIYSELKGALVMGVQGLDLYQIYLRSNTKYGDYSEVNVILDEIADSKLLSGILTECISGDLLIKENNSDFNSVLTVIKDNYSTSDGADKFNGDIKKINNVLSDFICFNYDKAFDESEIINGVVSYLSDENNSKNTVKSISEISFYKNAVGEISEVGLKKICNTLDIPMTDEDIYSRFLNDLKEELSDKSLGDYELEPALDYIVFLNEKDLSLSDYISASGEDASYKNYSRFISQLKELNKVFDGYYSDSPDDSLAIYKNGNMYSFDNDSEKWNKVSFEKQSETTGYSLVSSYLIKITKDIDDKTELTADIIKDKISENLNDEIFTATGLSDNIKTVNLKSVKEILNYSDFKSIKIAGKKITESLQKNKEYTEKDSEELSSILTVGCDFYNRVLKDDDEQLTTVVLNNFGKVGEILDGLTNYSLTENTAKILFNAILQNEEYQKYMTGEAVKKMIDNVENKKSTYKDLFLTIQSLYKIANQII